MWIWQDARLRTKVAASLLVATLGLAWFAMAHLLEVQADAADAARLQRLATVMVKVGDVLHESQRERGRTAQHMSSKGTAFGAELTAQRTGTDKTLADLNGYVATVGDLPGEARRDLEVTGAVAGELNKLRTQADQLGDPKRLISSYTTTNAALLDLTALLARRSRDAGLTLQLQSYVALANAEETLGLERAQLASAFITDAFAPGQFVLVHKLIAAQRAYLGVLEKTATPGILAAWDKVQKDSSFQQVVDFEQRTTELAQAGGFQVSGSTWFDAVTTKINKLKDLEDTQGEAILAHVAGMHDDANRAYVTALSVTVLLFLLVTALGLGVIVSITRPLREVVEVAQKMSTGGISQQDATTADIAASSTAGAKAANSTSQATVESTTAAEALGELAVERRELVGQFSV